MAAITTLRPALAGLALICASPSFAQDISPLPAITVSAQTAAGERDCFSLETAMALSSQRDPGVRVAQAERASADADLREAKSLYRPQVSAFARTGFGDVGLVDSTLQNQVGVRVQQRVFDFGDARFARRAARFAQEASGYVTSQARLDAAQGTGLAFLEFLENQDRLAVSRERVSYFEEQLRALDSLLAEGGATRTERANTASRLAEARAILLELEFEKDRASQRVLIDTGLSSAMCSNEEGLQFLSHSADVFPDEEAAIVSALTQNPTARALENRVREEEANEKRERAGRFPVLSVVGISAFSSTGSLQDLNQQNRVGIDVSLPLYSGNAVAAQLDRAKAQRNDAAARLAVRQRDLRLQISTAFRRIATLRELSLRRGEVAQQSWLRFEAAEQQFGFRAITLPELVEARIEYEEAQSQAIETKFDVWREYLELLALTGDLPF